MLIVTNYEALPARWRSDTGITGETILARSLGDFRKHGARPDAVFVINGDARALMRLVAARRFLPGFARPIVAIDIIFRRPAGLKGRVLHGLKRPLLAGADLYLNFFSDARGVSEVYGIPAARCAYVPFKVNLEPQAIAQAVCSEDYVLTFGRSLRDFDTFFAAMERVPYPGAIARPDVEGLRAHGARFTRDLDHLPANVRVLDDDGSARAQVDMLRRAKLVVVPVTRSSIVASGISTVLNAFALGKCVIGSQGPGMSDIFTDEILTVPPEDPAALAAAIARAWSDDDLRARTGAAGRACAERLGHEADLVQRLIDRIARAFG